MARIIFSFKLDLFHLTAFARVKRNLVELEAVMHKYCYCVNLAYRCAYGNELSDSIRGKKFFDKRRDFQLLKSYIPRIGFNLYAVLARSKLTKETHFRDVTSVCPHAISRVLFTGPKPTSLPSVRIIYLGHHFPILDQHHFRLFA